MRNKRASGNAIDKSKNVRKLAIALFVVNVGAVIVLLTSDVGYTPDTVQYSKIVFQPRSIELSIREVDFTPIPKTVPEVNKDGISTQRSRAPQLDSQSNAARARPKPEQRQGPARLEQLKKLLEESDGGPVRIY